MTFGKDDNAWGWKLHDLRCFDAVVRSGSFQAAAKMLNRTHPSVFAAVGRLEASLSLVLLDRGGYRVALTEAGRSFHEQATTVLADAGRLTAHARLLAGGEEPVLRVVLGDLCPRAVMLRMLSNFFAEAPATRLHIDYEAVGGPAARLADGSADLVFHRADEGNPKFERIELVKVRLQPVAAPGFLPSHLGDDATPDQLRRLTQCVIRDTAAVPDEEHFLIEGSHRCSVPDHGMKRELIVHGLAWGHLPDFMIEEDLKAGRLVPIVGASLTGRIETLAASRRADMPHGPVADRLWRTVRDAADSFAALMG